MDDMTTTLQPSAGAPPTPARRTNPITLPLGLTWLHVALAGIVIMAAFLRVISFDLVGDGNTYYTAAARSMLQSAHNFFFVVAEPGGSVTVDKPPVGLWLQAISAAIFGVNGFAVSLPQIIAGVLAVLVLYHLVGRSYGRWAGLIAAFVLAVSPVSVAVDRTNNIDSTLILTLLLAAWGFIRATETGKLRYLLIGAALVGVGFNIKMLQAYLVLPAFYALYFFGVDHTWRRKIVHMVAATAVLLAVSLSWVTVVDLTPADQRPYVGSSSTNSALELALGYNGLSRLFGLQMGGRGDGGARGDNPQPGFQPPADSTNGNAAPSGNFQTPANNGGGMMQFGPGGAGETGQRGVFRLLSAPLSSGIGWLLPAALLLMAALLLSERLRFPLGRNHRAVMVWGGWLATGAVFFSISSFFHAYYLATIAPPLAALIGIGVVHLWNAKRRIALLALVGVTALTAAYQVYNANSYGVKTDAQNALLLGLVVIGAVAAMIGLLRANLNLRRLAFGGLTAAMLVMPTSWALMTATDAQQSVVLPHAYTGSRGAMGIPGMGGGRMPNMFNAETISYLQANTQGIKYLVAVSSSMMGAPLVLQTGRPVLYWAGSAGATRSTRQRASPRWCGRATCATSCLAG
jgi:4-amino-4-deoxy-L-arabinose transferase-like glycosyltransferase